MHIISKLFELVSEPTCELVCEHVNKFELEHVCELGEPNTINSSSVRLLDDRYSKELFSSEIRVAHLQP